jgi:RHS repeat-associated protein
MNTLFIGDPIDVITGAQFDVALDFRIPWSFPFEWRRFYNTARSNEHLPLGWGHTHSYDHRLQFDANGLLYTDPAGSRYSFDLTPEGQISDTPRGRIRRTGPESYQVQIGRLKCEFFFSDPERPAQLRKVYRGRAFHELRYDSYGRWTELVYPGEAAVAIESDEQGRILALIRQRAQRGRDRLLWKAQYDSEGNLARVTDPYETTQLFSYDNAHRMIRHTDRRGYGFEASYDAGGRCVHSAGEDGMQAVTVSYRPDVRVSIVTRADGGAWQYFYENSGISQIIDPYGGVTRRFYGPSGRLERETGPMNEVLRQVVDEESGLLQHPFTPPVGFCLPQGDPWFQPVRNIHLPSDAMGWEGYGEGRCRNAIRFPTKDAPWLEDLPPSVANSLRFAESPREARQVEFVVPPAGALPPKKAIGVPPYPGVLRHDDFGRLISRTLPTGQVCRWQYDPNGNVIRYIDFAGSEWRSEYASWNLKIREIDPLGQTTSYDFNLLEKPVKVSDGGGTSTQHTFDLKDRLTERRRHDHLRDVFAYDLSAGLVMAASRNREVRIRFQFAPNRRPSEVAPADQPARKCTYDDRGRLIGVEGENTDHLQFTYASLGYHTADLRNGRGVERAYHASALTKTVLFGKFITVYERNRKAKQLTIVDPIGGRHVVEHPDLGIVLRRHASGTEELSQFEWNGQCLAKIRFRRNGTSKTWSRLYRYSPVGALLEAADSRRGTATYEYDKAHRLIGATDPSGKPEKFFYDSAGNLLAAPGLKDASYSENRLISANGHQFEYNERQHIVRQFGGETDRQYEYDAEDRLVSCRIGKTQIRFRYDALGRRIAKIAPDGTTEFIWDGERLAAEISPLGALRVHIYADGFARTPFAFVDYDSVDADPASGKRRYIYTNQIGCPVLVEDDDGRELWIARIDPYGYASVSPDSTIELNLRWPGHYYDPETGLHYNRHRYYSPELGRYIQVDPRDVDGGINVYAYPARPLDQVDVDGLAPCPKKAMVEPDESDPDFVRARAEATELAEQLRQALLDQIADQRANGQNTQALENTTLAALVVLEDGEWVVKVTGNRSDTQLPSSVNDIIGDRDYLGYGDSRPPNVLQNNQNHQDWVYPTERPNGTTPSTSHTDAEQRGLRSNDCNPDTSGVAYIAPTRPCCPGCYDAITTPTDQGGWGGNDNNISPRGLGRI